MTNNKTATIKILDEINIAVIGLTQKELEELSLKFSVYAKGYNFHPLFKLRKWDGKIRYFNKSGASYLNLASEIVPELIRMGYSVKYVDKRKYHNIDIPKIDETYFEDWDITLGQHQVDGVNAIVKHGNGMLIAGTGAGKSILAAVLCDLYERECGFRTIVIVPTIDLVDQTALEIKAFDLEVGTYSGQSKSLKENTIVSTWQTIQNNPKIMSQFQVVIVDECHGVTGKTLQDILNVHGSHIPVRIGMTGTLPKDAGERMAIRVCLGEVLFEVRARELMDKGWLAGLAINMYCLLEDLADKWRDFQHDYPEEAAKLTEKQFIEGYLPDYDAESTYLRKQTVRTTFVADFIENIRQNEKGNTFVLVKSVPFGRALSKLIENAIFVNGQDKTAVRKQIYKLFDEHDNLVVISTFQLASTGLNIKRIFNLVFVDAGKSFTKIIQAIGRGLRKARDKDFVNMYDFYSNLKYSSRHAAQRKTFYKEQKYNYTVKKVRYNDYYK
jgi:superfamily II DNA or RNA helicase